jgi:hypothetical protein
MNLANIFAPPWLGLGAEMALGKKCQVEIPAVLKA